MSLLDPKERTERGVKTQTELLGVPAPEPATLLQASWRDYVFAEVWTRPGLDRRSRYWIAIAGAAGAGREPQLLEGYIRGALRQGEVTLAELREAVLHFAVYEGWPKAGFFDECVTRIAEELGLPPAPIAPIRGEPWDPEVRLDEGGANYQYIMTTPPPPKATAYYVTGIRGFVFAEMWMRPGLDKRSRRWITLVGVADSSSVLPIQSHLWGALAAGDCTPEELEEFVLQYAVQAGWPMAAFLQQKVLEFGERWREMQAGGES
jgi:4-carboxymuconolactone decarboxylase